MHAILGQNEGISEVYIRGGAACRTDRVRRSPVGVDAGARLDGSFVRHVHADRVRRSPLRRREPCPPACGFACVPAVFEPRFDFAWLSRPAPTPRDAGTPRKRLPTRYTYRSGSALERSPHSREVDDAKTRPSSLPLSHYAARTGSGTRA